MNENKDLIWWEKTVEYYFVKNHLDINNIAPLDGNTESSIGDAVINNNDNFIIIEFKRDKQSLDSEKSKFEEGKYEQAKKEFEGQDNHHLLIYGLMKNGSFELNCKTYFSRKCKDIDKIMENTIDRKYFKKYIGDLRKFKKSTGSTSGGVVIGINENGGISYVDLSDVIQNNPVNEPAQTTDIKLEL